MKYLRYEPTATIRICDGQLYESLIEWMDPQAIRWSAYNMAAALDQVQAVAFGKRMEGCRYAHVSQYLQTNCQSEPYTQHKVSHHG